MNNKEKLLRVIKRFEEQLGAKIIFIEGTIREHWYYGRSLISKDVLITEMWETELDTPIPSSFQYNFVTDEASVYIQNYLIHNFDHEEDRWKL